MRKLALVATGKACRVGQYVFVNALILAISPKVTLLLRISTHTNVPLPPSRSHKRTHAHTHASYEK